MNFLPRVTALFLRVAQPLMRSLVTLPALHLFWSHSTLGTNGGNGNATLAPSANQTLEIGGTDTGSMTTIHEQRSGPVAQQHNFHRHWLDDDHHERRPDQRQHAGADGHGE